MLDCASEFQYRSLLSRQADLAAEDIVQKYTILQVDNDKTDLHIESRPSP